MGIDRAPRATSTTPLSYGVVRGDGGTRNLGALESATVSVQLAGLDIGRRPRRRRAAQRDRVRLARTRRALPCRARPHGERGDRRPRQSTTATGRTRRDALRRDSGPRQTGRRYRPCRARLRHYRPRNDRRRPRQGRGNRRRAELRRRRGRRVDLSRTRHRPTTPRRAHSPGSPAPVLPGSSVTGCPAVPLPVCGRPSPPGSPGRTARGRSVNRLYQTAYT